MPTAIIASKRFNPGHFSHIMANSKLLKSNGYDIIFCLHQDFVVFSDYTIKKNGCRFWKLLNIFKGDLLIVWFPSVTVIFDILLVRIFTRATIVYVYHEPYTSFSSYRTAGFSRLKAIRVMAISLVSRAICLLSDKIILPSTRAFNAVPRARLEPRSYAKINLMFADETGQQTQSLTREFISYIGTIAEDHAFDEFVRLMQGCIADQTLQPLRFLIATRSQVPKQHRAVIDQCLSTGRLVMQSGSPMSNEKINRFYAQSFVVWNAYRRSMQSGVLPKAYMFCTPVLVSTSNQSEYFQDGVHGVLISDRYSMQEFQHAIIRLVSEWSVISQNCRTYYLNNFDYRALSNMFMSFVLEKK